MNEEVKKKLIKALPNYEQCTGRLRTGSQFCILGVLCDLHGKETGNEWKSSEGMNWTYMGFKYILPPDVVEWSGLTQDGHIKTLDGNTDIHLSHLSDTGTSFDEFIRILTFKL